MAMRKSLGLFMHHLKGSTGSLLSRGIRVTNVRLQESLVNHQQQVEEQKQRNEANASYIELVRDFLDPGVFYREVTRMGIDFFCGVPDSLLKDFCAFVTKNAPPERHLITANEGTAVSLAAGHYLATGKYGLVYLQNSGMGNMVNPLMSLANPKVYDIPMLLLIGWRGEPGKRDEPQHVSQGSSTTSMLASMNIPFQVLPDYMEGAQQALKTARMHMENGGGPYAFLVKRQTFLPYSIEQPPTPFEMNREEALEVITDRMDTLDVIVSTTGMLSRELFELRIRNGQGNQKDFLTVGSMGHASSIGMGIALFKPRRQIWVLDGDGANIMHMGAMTTIGQQAPSNLRHVIINNGAHDSVGAQPTVALERNFSFSQIAMGCGYKHTFCAETAEEIDDAMEQMKILDGPIMLEVRVNVGSRKNLGRPTKKPKENKIDFMDFLALD